MTMYIFDTNVFGSLAFYYPKRFPTIWKRIDELAECGILRSVREVQREIESNCPSEHIEAWVRSHHNVFMTPNDDEGRIVAGIFRKEQYRALVKRENILKGLPVADPFVVAAAKIHGARVVTQESLKIGGARIPTLCRELNVECMGLEGFLESENLGY